MIRGVWPLHVDDDDPWHGWDEPKELPYEGVFVPKKPMTGAFMPSVDDMVRVGTDVEPALGMDGPDRVLGPWCVALDVGVPAHRDALAMAAAASVFCVGAGRWRAPWAEWARREPRATIAAREAFRAVDRAPWAVFAADEAEDWCSPAWFLAGWPAWVLARPVEVQGKRVATLAFGFPDGAPLAELRARAQEEVNALGLGLDVTRRASHLWLRRAFEWTWLHR